MNGDVYLSNTVTKFDGTACGFTTCSYDGNYRQVEQYEVPVSAIRSPTLDLDNQGCSVITQFTYSSLTTRVQVRSIVEN